MNGSSKFACIDGFGEELDELIYGGASNWFISFRSPFNTFSAHFSYFIIFFVIIICGLLSFRHSVENGKKYTQFWWAALIHGVVSERGLTARRYWHAQAPVMFFGKQLPLHIVFLYPSILYLAMMTAHRLNLNSCTEPAAVGLISMLMEIPYRMISVKFLHITYHDTDPLFYHKLCGVPWVEIFSSLVMASSFVALYHGSLYFRTGELCNVWDDCSPTRKEKMTAVFCGLASPVFGFIQKIVLFHVLNDFFNVNIISCWLFVVSLYVSFVVCFEPKKIQKCVVEDSKCKTYLFSQVLLYLGSLLFLGLFGNPENEISIGTHEPTGDCTMLIVSRSPLGKPLKRKKYLCADEVAARTNFVFNFDCLEEGPPCLHAIWYTICGSPIYNRAQFFLNILSFVILVCTVFSKTMFCITTQLDAAKRFILKLRGEVRQRPAAESPAEQGREEPSPPVDEVTVGFVFVKNNTQVFSKHDAHVKLKLH